jgi:Protein of unknown function (DUF2891)
LSHQLDSSAAGRFARLALDCVGREYPNHPLTVLFGVGDVRSPREHTPAFFGCFDWHSAVHGHWTLVRLLRFFPTDAWSGDARSVLRDSLRRRNLDAEVRHLSRPGREGFERPYGLAWFLQLAAELREWDDPDAPVFVSAVEPLERLCRDRLAEWLPKLSHPIRSGEHSQTAFAMALALDWAVTANDGTFADFLRERSLTFYARDVDLPLRFEPSGHDFLSPSLAEADLMRRVLPRDEFREWMNTALPELTLAPVVSVDRADGKLAHLDGLNLSRAWMLDGIASVLDCDDCDEWRRAADEYAQAGVAAVTGEHYAGGHWLGTFATYLLTRRGIRAE